MGLEFTLRTAREAHEARKVVGAIYIAPVILANSGILEGKNATVWDGEHAELLKARGATYKRASVVVDGRVVTANAPEAAEDFAKAWRS